MYLLWLYWACPLLGIRPDESLSTALASGHLLQYVLRVQSVCVKVCDGACVCCIWWCCVVSFSLWGVVSPVGGASAQTAGPWGNIDAPDISQASSDDLHDGVELGGFLFPAPSLSFVEMATRASFCCCWKKICSFTWTHQVSSQAHEQPGKIDRIFAYFQVQLLLL